MELLAPAGSLESLKAAIYAGADAVYLGGKKFNARKGAENFSIDELKIATELAHDYDAKVYLTINTLTHETELAEMGDYICEVSNCGVDAFIVQDLGVAKLANDIAPHVELHASTQMTIHATQALPLLIENNFKRVVLAREVSLAAIKQMSDKYPELGLEVFVHGALCYAYSGQCLMSSIIGGRSGNRGACAGPCRLPYTLMRDGNPYNTKGNYLMSPKDLCLISDLEQLKESGASSLKIEGRLKRPDYVYTVVSRYRKAIDEGRDFKLTKADKLQLSQAFNRGFTKGIILGHTGDKLMNTDRPDNRGVEVGVVKDCYKGRLKVKALCDLKKGDTLAWHTGQSANTFKLPKDYKAGEIIQIKCSDNLKNGSGISRVVSIEQQQIAAEAMRRPVAKFGLNIVARLVEGKPFELTGTDSKGYHATVISETKLETALNKVASADYITKQLSKLGGTSWYLTNCQVNITGKPAIRSSELNECRRQLINKLTQLRRVTKTVDVVECQKSVVEQLSYDKHQTIKDIKPKLAVTTQTMAELKAAIASSADLVYLGGPEWYSITTSIADEIKESPQRFVLRLPRITNDKDLEELKLTINQLKKLGIKRVVVDNLAELAYLKHDKDLELISGSGIPVFNTLTIKQLKNNGIKQATLSPELNYQQMQLIAKQSVLPIELLVHGSLLLMVHESCLLSGLGSCNNACKNYSYTLKDRKNYLFPLKFDSKHRSYLYNCQDLALFDKIPELLGLKPAVLRVEGAGRGADYVKTVTNIYQQIIQYMHNDGQISYEKVRIELLKYSNMGLTRAHWQRGV